MSARPGGYYHDRSKQAAHDHVVFHMSSGARISFNDPRRFGMMKLVPRAELEQEPLLRALGPEPLGNEFDAAMLARACKGKKTSLKAALSDQKIVAGLGNIYVCEALHRARLSPKRRASTIATKSGAPNRARADTRRCHQGRAQGRHCGRRLVAARSPPHRWRAGQFPAQFPRLRSREPAVPHAGLPRHHQTHGSDRQIDVLLPGVPEVVRFHSFAGSVLPSHCAMTAAISLLFFSFIITWLLPLMPMSASRMKVGCAPACRRYFTVQWSYGA